MPSFLERRFARFKNPERTSYLRQRYPVVLSSLLIGITSHLVWDKMLHKSVSLAEEPMDFYPIFWDGNSVVGAALIVAIIWS